MSAGDTLAAIARGEASAGLLQTCRLSTDAGEAYGIEAVSVHFRAAPITDGAPIGVSGTVAVLSGDTILFADAYDSNIARIWRIGSGGPVANEARIDVAFDPDMAQARGDVSLSPSDFPDVPQSALTQIAEVARAAIGNVGLGPIATRSRLFLLRVAIGEGRVAALFAHHSLALGDRGDAGFRHVAVLLDGDAPRWFVDTGPDRGWTPRV